MDTGPQENSSPPKKTWRCCYRDFLYTPRHAELLHLRRKESIQLSARFAALFVIVLMIAVPFWDGSFASEMWSSQTFILRLLVAGVALAVLTNRAVSARLRRRLPYLPMLMLIVAASLLCVFAGNDPLATDHMHSSHSFLLIGLVMMIAIMPVTLVEAGLLSLPFVVLLAIGAQSGLETGFVPFEMLLAFLLPLALVSALVQLYRTITAAHEIAIDPLTNCYTRAFGMEMIRVSFEGALRKKVPYTIAFIDLDDFKQINDRYGHDYGDRILGEVGNNLIHRFRRSDMVVRWGGEEFLVLLPELDRTRAAEVLERVMAPGLAMLESGKVQCASVGLSERIEDAIALPQNLIDLADQRMYDAKKRRDRDDLVAQGYSGRRNTVSAMATPSASNAPSVDRSVN
ncbi:diguanylate cyclase [Thalassospira sp. HJ]|uniref:GGDEF domain-containing protein n=1 Tax=Thalassospira sp. HJ TaxID=1616823 RepID=UPI0005CE587C|nr:GGDEF domain-containing protein [Thalassospira sp. HJ]KJE35179.1 diguanylate cyclase [Thalassospira sp. HJ]